MKNTSPTMSDDHHFSKPSGVPGYASLTTAERWQWHAHTYAWRRVFLGVADSLHTSPCDPNGEWFDAEMVERETERLRRKWRHRSFNSAAE